MDYDKTAVDVLDGAAFTLAKAGREVTPEAQLQLIESWILAVRENATSPRKQEMLTVFEQAYDTLYCQILGIQF